MNDRVDLVTGGAGFIGSHLSAELLRRGRRVRILDNLSTGRLANLERLRAEAQQRLEFVEGDVRDLELVQRCARDIDRIFHLAAIPSVQRSIDDPLQSNAANVDGTLNVFVAARDSGARKVVYASSSSVYGDSERLPKEEGMVVLPISPYGVSKYVDELYGKVFGRIYGLPTVGLRYFNVFGPAQDPGSEYAAVIPKFITRMLNGKPPIIFGDGEQTRDFTFVGNVVDANLCAAETTADGIALNIACGERYSLNQLVGLLNELLGTHLSPVYEKPRAGDIKHSLADIRLAAASIGYRPRVSFHEGLAKTVDWFQSQGFRRKE